ncbi:MtnX-like HAD-IB family phosphatase [Bartonella tamiae]|uniref:2,3-diketo-5-methylthio-1-phosphopentane phosphatase n=1 Tax=Bartonella tamiae Th239 TaxID=1094558 RepID=J1JXE1_9HYPH|nr:MtnX-like HAD-IB family phosphatase [Bartonella tamiae]EJF89285.1 2,3-diketo-5-methylthio-1-phosphopentane phosphatase [Bartonella tamiae Th239]EJF95553.1 2,3-diketo-5-methylthio-1-phosphopentane phosphatase [Bartonella tamiae Th307]
MTLTFPDLRNNKHPSSFSTVFIDFDGTIAKNDVTDILLRQFASADWEEIEEEWLSGKIGARECMSHQISLIKASPEELNACLDQMEIDPYFIDFIEILSQERVNVAIVSDGLDFSIHRILKRYNIVTVPIFANRLIYLGNDHWTLQFPYKNDTCSAGNCKCSRYNTLQRGFTLYIGDGTSDFCPSEKADLVLAKGKLADYCNKQHLNHIRIDNFSDVCAIWHQFNHQFKPFKKVAS